MIFWGIGKIADSAVLYFISFFLLYYYNQILNLKSFLATIALAIALLFDALSDPIVGLVSDFKNINGEPRSRLMILSIIPCSVALISLFIFEIGNSQVALFIQLTLLVIVLRIALTLFSIPREALGAQLFKGYSARNSLWALNSFFSVVGGSLALGPTMLFFLTDWNDKSAYASAVIWTAIIYVLFSSICSFKIKKYEKLEVINKKNYLNFSIKRLYYEFCCLLKNRSWLMLFISCLIFSMHQGLNSSIGLYINNFIWHWRPSDLFWGGFLSLPGSIFGAFLIFSKEIKNKKTCALFIGLLSLFTTPLLLNLRIIEIYFHVDILPEIGQGVNSMLWWLWGLQQFTQNFTWTMFWILIASMFSDTIEQHALLRGLRLDGMVLSANNIINKSLLSGGLLLSGVLLSYVGFDDALPASGKEIAAFKLSVFSSITIFCLLPFALYFLSKYRITKDIHEKNITLLEGNIIKNKF